LQLTHTTLHRRPYKLAKEQLTAAAATMPPQQASHARRRRLCVIADALAPSSTGTALQPSRAHTWPAAAAGAPPAAAAAAAAAAPGPPPAAGPAAAATFPTADAVGVAPTSDAALALHQLQEHGFCILDAVIPHAAIPALRASAEATALAHDSGAAEGVWHVGGVLTHDQSIAEWVGHRRVLDVVEAAFATPEIRVTYTTLQVNQPGCAQQIWHADGHSSQPACYPAPFSGLRRPAHINTLWMLSDFTAANGATWLVPNSHAWPAAVAPQQAWTNDEQLLPHPDAVHAAAPAGCVCVFDCRLWHALAPNHTDQTRTMVNVRYAPKYIPLEMLIGDYQGQPPWPPMPQHVYDSLPRGLKPLYEHAPKPPPAKSTAKWDLG
jgi:hypothetical protein